MVSCQTVFLPFLSTAHSLLHFFTAGRIYFYFLSGPTTIQSSILYSFFPSQSQHEILRPHRPLHPGSSRIRHRHRRTRRVSGPPRSPPRTPGRQRKPACSNWSLLRSSNQFEGRRLLQQWPVWPLCSRFGKQLRGDLDMYRG